MNGNFYPCLDFSLLPDNDGQAAHCSPGDNGSWTSWGVTRANWSRWIGRSASITDMQAITSTDVTPLYRLWFWSTISGDDLPVGIDLCTFDMGVLAGEHAAATQLQQVLGFTGADVDGDIGPVTLARLDEADRIHVIDGLSARQEVYFRACATFDLNGKGWLARLARRTEAAKAMVLASVPTT